MYDTPHRVGSYWLVIKKVSALLRSIFLSSPYIKNKETSTTVTRKFDEEGNKKKLEIEKIIVLMKRLLQKKHGTSLL